MSQSEEATKTILLSQHSPPEAQGCASSQGELTPDLLHQQLDGIATIPPQM